MYDRILIPTDGSTVADTAAEAAVALARRFDSDLHAIHVREREGSLPEFEDGSESTAPGDQAVRGVVEMAKDVGVEATTAIIEDDEPVHRAIVAYADEHDVDCIVMGTYGRTGLDRFVLGSVAERTVRESPVPVMTVHEDTVVDLGLDDVLVPTDGSSCAEAAADHAIELAQATDAALHVIHVVDLGVVWDDADTGMVLDALEEAGEEAIDRLIDRAEAADIRTIEASVLSGTPPRAIVEYADEYDVDCIVMGTHGRTGLDRYLLGSVTERVVRLSDTPVLTISEPDGAD